MPKMDIEFKNFYKKDQKEIMGLVKIFLDKHFYVKFPNLRRKVSIIITGSIAISHYDEFSDIDINIIFANEQFLGKYKDDIGDYKKNDLIKLGVPLQIHSLETYDGIVKKCAGWNNDVALREFSTALIVDDPAQEFEKIQRKYRWYPPDVYKEKISWLFAELTFVLTDRYKIAIKRKDNFFSQLTKLKIVKLAFCTILFLNKKFAASDKHLYFAVKKLNTPGSNSLLKLASKVMDKNNLDDDAHILDMIRNLIEKELINKKLIKKESELFWINYRPKYSVILD